MFEEILPGLFRVEIPLPGSPLKAVNSYFVRSQGQVLIVDVGMNREECKQALLANSKKLHIQLAQADFFVTHLHADHVGLAGPLSASTSRVYMGSVDAAILKNGINDGRWASLSRHYGMHGFPDKEIEEAVENLPGRRYGPKEHMSIIGVADGTILDFGDYRFRCIHTPGHTPGHMCLHEVRNGLLFSGDHILGGITPNICYWPEMTNPLGDYLLSLDKISTLKVNLVLPGHREVFENHIGRIGELKQHHRSRLDEILLALKEGKKSAFQIAPHVTWDMDYDSWEQFPPLQKWFAIGEVVAHLMYLESEGVVGRRRDKQRIVFNLRDPELAG